jgi:hypothetical protein
VPASSASQGAPAGWRCSPSASISSAETSPMPTRSAMARFLARVVAVVLRSFSSFCLPRQLWKRLSSLEQ